MRARAPYVVRATVLAVVVMLVAAAPLLVTQFVGAQRPGGLAEVGSNGLGNDLAALVVPTAQQWLAPPVALQVASRWAAQTTGQGAYLGVFALALLAVAVVAGRRDLAVRTLAILTLVLVVLSLGPSLSVDGRSMGVPLPDIALQHLPLLTNMVPLRWSFYAEACAIATAALALAQQPRGRARMAMAVLAVLTLASWFPSLPRPVLQGPLPAALPPAVSAQVPGGTTVLFVPCAGTGDTDAMYYQAVGGFQWNLVGGYAYFASPGSPVAQGLCRATPPAGQPQGDALLVALHQEGVGVVIVPPGSPAQAARLTAMLGSAPRVSDGFSLWVLCGGARKGRGSHHHASIPLAGHTPARDQPALSTITTWTTKPTHVERR